MKPPSDRKGSWSSASRSTTNSCRSCSPIRHNQARCIGKLLGIRLPPAISKLLVDDLPGCGLVEIDLLSGGFALLDDLLEIDGCSLGEALRSVQACAESLSFLLSLGGELFPCRTFLGFLAGALLGGLPGAGVFLGRESGLLGS
jgi:hypothetical protein